MTSKEALDFLAGGLFPTKNTPEYKIVEKDLEKLDKIENIEEELKCPLDFVAIPYRLVGLRKIWYRKQYCEVVRIVAYEEATRPYMEVRVEGLKHLKLLFLDNYKDTWFLTKEESENGKINNKSKTNTYIRL